jgi:hypothetical protein
MVDGDRELVVVVVEEGRIARPVIVPKILQKISRFPVTSNL